MKEADLFRINKQNFTEGIRLIETVHAGNNYCYIVYGAFLSDCTTRKLGLNMSQRTSHSL